MKFLLASLLFDGFWLLAVMGQSSAELWLVFILCGVLFYARDNLIDILGLAMIGIAGDSVLIANNVLVFEHRAPPLWLCLLWFAFSAYVVVNRSWFIEKSNLLLITVGAVGGGLSYVAGVKLGAVQFGMAYMPSVIIMLVSWFIYSLIFLLWIKKAPMAIKAEQS